MLFIRYGISGGVAALIQIVFLYLWVSVLGFQGQYLWGVVIGFFIAFIVSFSLQKYWTFRDISRTTSQQFISYGLISILNVVLITAFLDLTRRVLTALGINFFRGWYLLAQVIIICAVAVMSLILNRRFTFTMNKKDRI